MKRLITVGIVLIVAAAGLQLLPQNGGSSESATVDVALQDNLFSPEDITINVGDTVNWDWAGTSNTHSVTSDDGSSFDSTVHSAPNTFQHTFNTAGTFGYHCTVHGSAGQGMYGTITVQQQAATSTPAAGATNTPAAAAASATPAAGGTTAAGAATPTVAATLPSTGTGDDGGGIGWLTWTSVTLALVGAGAITVAALRRRSV